MTAPSRRTGGAGKQAGAGRRYASPAASTSPTRGRSRTRSSTSSSASTTASSTSAAGRRRADTVGARRAARHTPPDRTLRGYARVHGTGLTLTTRAALLALALCAVVLTLAYPAREYLAQHRQINQLASQVAQDRQTVAALTAAGRRDNDPTFIEDQARLRLHMKRPGDQVFLLPMPAPVKPGKQRAGAVRTPELPGRSSEPWYSQLYRSTVESGK